jgi:hypothetical protein
MRAHDVVLLRPDKQRHVLVAYEFERGAQDAQVVDVRGIRIESAGEGARLVAGCLVGGVEDVFERGVRGEHVCVEFCGYGFSMLGEDRDGGFDDLDLGWG